MSKKTRKAKLFSIYHQPTAETWYYTDEKLFEKNLENLIQLEMKESECDRRTAEMRIDYDELYVNEKVGW